MSARSRDGGAPPRTAPDGTQAALALAFAFYEAFNTLDREALRSICAPDVVLSVGNGELRGVEEVIGYFADLHHHLPGIRVEHRVVVLTPQHVVTESARVVDPSVAVPAAAGWKLPGRGCDILEIEGGRVASLWDIYINTDDDQLGGADLPHPAEAFRVAQEQAAFHRVVGLVTREPTPDAVLAAVNQEIGLIAGADATSLLGFHDDDTMTRVAAWSADDATLPIGDRRPMTTPMLEMRRTAVGHRSDVLPDAASSLSEQAHGVRSRIAVPLLVEDTVWGVALVDSRQPRAFPAGTEDRVLRFTALAGIAIAHARARTTLAASRARVLAAADASRRQVQRDLHDGAQQRLVQTILGLKVAREAAAGHQCAAADLIDEALGHAERTRTELHDLARGVLPEVLTRHGLRAALHSLAEHLPLEVALEVDVRRLPVAVETAAYFVVAEALTNVVKHAGVREAAVRVGVDEDGLRLEISDRGTGGAATTGGTGLRGLADRVEAGGGSFAFDSPRGGGTTIRVAIPLPPG